MEVFNVSLLFLSSALDEAAAALTRMRAEPSVVETGRSLVAACSEGDIGRVRRLLDEGRVSVHETTEEGESLLSLACSAGYYELAQVSERSQLRANYLNMYLPPRFFLPCVPTWRTAA